MKPQPSDLEETDGDEHADDELVEITRAEFDELRSRAATSSPTSVEIAELERLLEARERRLSELDANYRSAVRDRELAAALAGRSLVPNAASQLIKLWRDDFELIEDGGRTQVVAKDGRTLEESVKDRLEQPEFAHFCLATSRGGVRGKGIDAVNSTPEPSKSPRNLGEIVIQQWRHEAALRKPESTRTIGLGRRR